MMPDRSERRRGIGTVGAFRPPERDRDRNGLLVTWTGAQRFTRAETRYGIFYTKPPSGWTGHQNCFGTVAAAVAAGEQRPGWHPDHVFDYQRLVVVHDFRGRLVSS